MNFVTGIDGNAGILTTNSLSFSNCVIVYSSNIYMGNTTANVTITIPTAAQISSGQFYLNANGMWMVPGAPNTAVPNTGIMFDDSGAIGANEYFTFNKLTGQTTWGNSTANVTTNSSTVNVGNTASLNTTVLFFGNSTVNVVVNSTSVTLLAPGTVQVTVNDTIIQVGNSSVFTSINATSVNTGTVTGALSGSVNVVSVAFGNSTANSVVNSVTMNFSSTTGNSSVNAGTIRVGNNSANNTGFYNNAVPYVPGIVGHVTLATQVSVANNTYVKVAFDTVTFDTGSFWDSANHRFKPTIAGYYRFSYSCYIGSSTTATRGFVVASQNGTVGTGTATGYSSDFTGTPIGTSGSVMAHMNGSTDTMELDVFIDAVTPVAGLTGSSYTTYFEYQLVKPDA